MHLASSLAFVLRAPFLLLLLLATHACGGDPSSTDPKQPGSVVVGLFQIVDHPAVDQIRGGFEGVLKGESVSGKTIKFDHKNAQNDSSLVDQIAERYVANQVDLVFAMGTPCVLAMAAKSRKIPVVAGAMTDPVAGGVAASWAAPGRNVTGTSDLPPVHDQFALAKQLIPSLSRVGLVMCPSEANSVAVMARAREAAKALGLTLVEKAALNTAEVATAVSALVGNCEAVYVPPDNTVHAALASVVQVARAAKLPVFDCTEDSVRAGALFALAVDYKVLGELSGKMALEILRGGNPATMPIRVIDRPSLVLNADVATALGIEIPSDVRARARLVQSK
jgi:putative ABC transport system substrate-binding protein